MNKFNALKYIQDDQEYYITVLPFHIIQEVTTTLVYSDKEPYGYQRDLNPSHYKKILKSINKSNELISPTSIVLGINRSDFNKEEIENIKENIYSIIINPSNGYRPYRIIDGQHRLKGLGLAVEKNDKLLNYNLSVIIMIIDDNNRRREVKVFNNINSKAKPLKMDLTILALYKYDLLEMVKEFDVIEHIAIRIAHILNEDRESVWKNAIKLDVNNSNSFGIIGFKTFFESIKPMCEQLVKRDPIFEEVNFEEKLAFVNYYADMISGELLIPCWNIIHQRWSECFEKNIGFNNFEEVNTLYNKNYYIQKTMGAKSINSIISQFLLETDGNIKITLDLFKTRIDTSNLNSESWKVGGIFSGLSSEAGFKKIRELI
ncbi:DGQHR domain-containing protein [Neobacillus mesonae]|uniref:DGQHR domain-containing protein n=1 Tax=Neobacillus mesonae TaxID=1193713 RepID=UPI0025727EBD|nr:DGQHR domain-containing protein [Neobacillus mesonae]